MKRSYLSAPVCLLTASLISAMAAPIGNVSAGRRYLIAAQDLTPWTAGLFVRSGEREAQVSGWDRTFDYTRLAFYIGYDVFTWITPYVLIGANNTDLDGTGEGEFKPEWGFGMRLNLLHHDIMDPTLFEDTILVNASWQYSVSQAMRKGDEQEMHELCAVFTLSVLNEFSGSKLYLPEGMALFGGPIFSLVDTSGADMKEDYGLVAGLEVYYTKRISFYIAGELMGKDSAGVMVGINLSL